MIDRDLEILKLQKQVRRLEEQTKCLQELLLETIDYLDESFSKSLILSWRRKIGIQCPTCGGTGHQLVGKNKWIVCPECEGSGEKKKDDE